MQLKPLIYLLFGPVFGLGFSAAGLAADLTEVYQQASGFDPMLQKAAAARLSAREAGPQSTALVLPTLAGAVSTTQTRYHNSVIGEVPGSPSNYGTNIYSLSLNQPLFNFASWMTMRQADAKVKQADATYGAALQELMQRIAKVYLAVLNAEDALRITEAQKKLLARQLDEAQQRFDVGLNTMTEVYNAQASYDSIVALQITNQNEVNNQYELLRSMTGKRYENLAIVNKDIPLIKPNPANVEEWVKGSETQNLSLKAIRFGVDAAREGIKVKASGHLPSLMASGAYTRNTGGINSTYLPGVTEGSSLGLTLSVPLYQGGLVLSQTRQAQYDFSQATADLELNHQNIIAQTRQKYAGVLADIAKISADKAAIKSASSAYESNLAAYRVGTKTNVDVLTAQKALFDAQRIYATDQYAYLSDTIILKQLAGTLNERDLQTINSWLKVVDKAEAKKLTEKKLGVTMSIVSKPNAKVKINDKS